MTTTVKTDTAGDQPWESITLTFSDDGTLSRRVVVRDSGRIDDETYDDAGVLLERHSTFANGREVTFSFYPNGNLKRQISSDLNDGDGWTTSDVHYREDGTKSSQTVIQDNGIVEERTFNLDGKIVQTVQRDEQDQKSWDERVIQHDGSGTPVSNAFTADSADPNTAPDNVSTKPNTEVTIDVLANDTDPDGDSLSILSVEQANNGSVAIDTSGATDQVIYTPDADFVGTDTFTYVASDGKGGTKTETVTVEVKPLIQINEVLVSTTSTDVEFIEIKGDPGTSLAGLSVLNIEGGPSNIGNIDNRFDLPSDAVIGENGFFLIGNSLVEGALGVVPNLILPGNFFENSSSTIALVETATISGSSVDGTETAIDAIGLTNGDGTFFFGAPVLGPDGVFYPSAAGRNDSTGEWELIDAFSPAGDNTTPTPGADVSEPIVLNEIVVSTTGTDFEFVEIVGEAGASLDGIALIQIDGDGDVRSVLDFSGKSIGDNGFFLAASAQAEQSFGVTGNQQFANNTFTNTSSTYLLVEGFDGDATGDLDTNDDGVLDIKDFTGVLDAVALIDDDTPLTYEDATVIGPDGSFLAPGAAREPDGTGDWVMKGFFSTEDYSPTAGTESVEASLVINEIDADQTSTDSAEFIELFDGGVGNVSLDGYFVVLFNGSSDTAYDTISLEGHSTDDNGYFVIGSSNVTNVDLVEFTTNGLQNGADAVALYKAETAPTAPTTTGLVDAIVYDTNDSDDSGLLTGLGLTTQYNEAENGDSTGESLSRIPNGTGAFEAKAPTPGESNDGSGGGGNPGELSLISAIQGTGSASAMVGQTVTVRAIVVGDFQTGDADTSRDLRGFFLQEEAADSDDNAATSEGIFVFDSSFGTDVNVGDLVEVTGTVSEFQDQTQISASSISVVTSSAVSDINTMAQDVSLAGISDVILDGNDRYVPDLEAYEGMLLSITDTLTVNELFQLDRFNEMRLTSGDRPDQFTQNNEPDVAGFDAHLRSIGSNQIIYDDGLNVQNAPIIDDADLNNDGKFDTSDEFSMGDTVDNLTGVLNWGWAGDSASPNSWRIRSVEDDANTFVNTETRDETPPDVGGSLKVASFNVLNFFTTLDVSGNPGSGPNGLDPRGPDNQEEYDRQLEKLVTTLTDIDADIFGLVEIENEFGTDQNGDGLVAINELVAELNTVSGAGTWAAVDPGAGFVDTGDAISVGMIYKVASVTLDSSSVDVLTDSDLPGLGGDYGTGPVFDGPSTNRAPLAASFTDIETGEDFTIAVTHMKSKGGSGTGGDADANDGAGNFNETRTEGVEALLDWLDVVGDEDVFVLGDLNAYAKEDPIDVLVNAGYRNLEEEFQPGSTSFVFDGQQGTLDYAFANAAGFDAVTGAAIWEINSSEPDAIDYNTDFGRDKDIFDGQTPFRSSDHDPLIFGLDFGSDTPLA